MPHMCLVQMEAEEDVEVNLLEVGSCRVGAGN